MSRLLKMTVIVLLFFIVAPCNAQDKSHQVSFEFYNKVFNIHVDSSIVLVAPIILSKEYVDASYDKLNSGRYKDVLDTLISFKNANHLNDWLYYQLIRKTAEVISPKKESFERYTLFKWFLLVKSGYDAHLTIADHRMIMYIFNQEDISEIPFVTFNKKKYMCLNYHDYAHADLNKVPATEMISRPEGLSAFSYKVTMLPNFKAENYKEKNLQFKYRHKIYHFSIKLNEDVESVFTNYPGVEFKDYFNIPMSRETYGSLIPVLKQNVRGMKQKKGVDYLMRFTRYAFLYEDDQDNYGRERRLSPEETLSSTYSDCDDRVALFFYLVKEIYNLPMIALLYPTHITMAVQFDQPIGDPIVYNGKIYSMCEPTPQKKDLSMGQITAKLKKLRYEVVYCYEPSKIKN
jgi:hypothetical protein